MSDTKQQPTPALLPSGFVDVLAPEADSEARAISILMESFTSFGYQRIKPPLAEFENSLFAGDNGELAENTFRVMDPSSHKMMGIRSDITPQLARIATSRLVNEPRPLRLTYANDVLRTRAGQQRTERQFCQVGCEIIGSDHVQSDIEACVMAVMGFKKLGIPDVTLDLTMPRLVDYILEDQDLSDTLKVSIKTALSKKDIKAVSGYSFDLGELFEALFKSSGVAPDSLAAIKAIGLPFDIIDRLETVTKGVMDALGDLGYTDVNITIDPLEFKGFDYQNGIGFTLFSPHARGEMGRGGRYDIGDAANRETATGFTLYMDTVRKAMPEAQSKQVRSVPASSSWAELNDMAAADDVTLVRDFES